MAMPDTSPSPASPGRPRSLRAQRDILDATSERIEKGGYPAATIEAIAARSGVAKTTIYRWWPNRAALVVDLLVQVAAEAAAQRISRRASEGAGLARNRLAEGGVAAALRPVADEIALPQALDRDGGVVHEALR